MAAARGGPNLGEERRKELAGTFQDGGEHYDRVRPGYPADSVEWLLGGRIPPHLRGGGGSGHPIESTGRTPPAVDVVDIGAGTGKFTGRLIERGLNVVALDPSRDMLSQLDRRFPTARTIVGTAEEMDLPDASMDAATVAQAWHWCDPLRASTEIARVLRPGGLLGLIWNQLDVSVPWVHRLSRIMHAGDVHRPHFRPVIGPEFTGLQSHLSGWAQPLTPPDIRELVKSRSYYLGADEASRMRVMANLRWYFREHLGHADDDVLQLPYLTQTWRAHSVER
ncbi:MAG: class I SAM-dependent methyltransferase [Actinomycetota bacterium]|nr:class I SAM-dependent methyltransferase [Actinomycetota bacterium]